MATTNDKKTARYRKNKKCVKARGSRVSRGCRAFQQATVDLIVRAVGSWKSISGSDVEVPDWKFSTCSELASVVKEFLSSTVSDDESLQMGFQSIKKLLPDSCRCMESVLLDNLVRSLGKSARQLPPGYLSFVKSETKRLFPKGWDATYEGFCLSTSPSLASCCESGRASGGALGALQYGQGEYLDRVLHGRGPRLCPHYAGALMVVQSAGKPRPLSKFPAEALFLKPLHKTIYGSLSQRSWLLRGPPSGTALKRAGFDRSGGQLVSGDYKSATDNLPIEVMELALSVMLDNAEFVPANVKELALRACRPILFSDKESLQVKVGQMMGSFLSFPFLCLQNYLSFRWALKKSGIRGRVPVLINGDDILYQTPSPEFPQRWFEVVGQVGLEVEKTKTSVASDYGSLNSTLLRWGEDGKLYPVWSPRFGMLRAAEHPASLGRSFLDFLDGAPAEYRFKAGRVWFSWHVGELRSAHVSLPSLGFRGLLAKRLAGLYGCDRFEVGELPRAPLKHGVHFTADFVMRCDALSLSAEERFFSSIEIAGQKWSGGYLPEDRVREAVRYCVARTACKGNRFDYPSDFSAFWAGPEESRFRQRNRLGGRESRRVVVKPWLAPLTKVTEVLLATSVVQLLSDFAMGVLPPYNPLPGVVDLGSIVETCG